MVSALAPGGATAHPGKVGARLVLENGLELRGWNFGAVANAAGEAVFQTGMVGYTESLTDPSYASQILVMTFPLIGNYGVPDVDKEDPETGIPLFAESSRVHVSGLVVSDYSEQYSHWNAASSLGAWLAKSNVPAIFGIDTRHLTKIIRQSGTMLAKIIVDGQPPDIPWNDPSLRNLVADVSTSQPKTFGPMQSDVAHIAAVDCGMKNNQLRCLLDRGVRITVVPWDYDFASDSSFDGIFVSNGPGDPTMAAKTIETLKRSMDNKARPIFGICLGHQLLSLAAGFSTFKLKYGNRGHNQPCIDETSKRCYITSQNHGYAVDASRDMCPADWIPLFTNANDGTNEGVMHRRAPFFSVQFHPEAKSGPHDTEHLFDVFLKAVQQYRESPRTAEAPPSSLGELRRKPTNLPEPPKNIKKILILGSGGLSIGQAGEFDYSGSQAVKALKEEGIQTVLINPNIATVQTSKGMADKVYFLPVTPENVMKVARNERPDGILATFGGQTALNCAIELHRSNELEELGVRVLGTPIEAILDTEDRDRFNARLSEIGEPFAMSEACSTTQQCVEAAERIKYPVIVRAAFALGGLGSGFANNVDELRSLTSRAFSSSHQVLVERSMRGWKEIEYEVVRDAFDNCITVCNMENFDPLGVHTGDSIVIAPSQTLTDAEYNMLRDAAQRTVRKIGVVGECNIQYALNPTSQEYCIIEVNARLSRSSALASKATGYPLAAVAAKLALGHRLSDIRNSVTKETTACFEPSLDYLVVKFPRWDLKKFTKVDKELGSSMKSVGEVMSIGRNFEEAIQKAVRMVKDNYVAGLESDVVDYSEKILTHPTEDRIFSIVNGLANGKSVDEVHALSMIDKWFLYRLENIVKLEKVLGQAKGLIGLDLLARAKQLGFSDRHIAKLTDDADIAVRKRRVDAKLVPAIKQIDTVAAEFPAKTNYLYATYASLMWDHPVENDVVFDDKGIMVLGSGAYRIGSSVEFDWCAVSATRALKRYGYKSVMVNYNPETVSTDYDECDRLYFDELSFERVLDIYSLESASGIIISMGGQMPNNIAMPLHRHGAKILGTSPDMIDGAENRFKFSRMLDRLGVDQPQWKELASIEDAKAFCGSVGYPVLVRPSYVLSGAAMNVAHKADDLEAYLSEAATVSPDCPVVISKFILQAKEIEVDAVALKGELVMHVVSEHVENAGVHSGDATIVLPPQDLDRVTVEKVEEATRRVANALNVSGPMNIQFIAKNNEIKVIECNVRASRSFPFVSKTVGLDLARMATKVMLGRPVRSYPVDVNSLAHVGVKVSQFSFTRLLGADPILGVEMASTGEVACFGSTREEAYLKGLLATNVKEPQSTVCLSIGTYKEKLEFLSSAKQLVAMDFTIYATPGTADFLAEHGVPSTIVLPPQEEFLKDSQNTLVTMLHNRQIDLLINIPSNNKYRREAKFESPGYLCRRAAVDHSVPLITNIKCAKILVRALEFSKSHRPLLLSPYDARFSSRVVRLPGLISIDNAVEKGGVLWSAVSRNALSGGFTFVGGSDPSFTATVSGYQAVRNAATGNAYCDYGVYVYASSSNAAIVQQLSSTAAGICIDANSKGSTIQIMKHLESWPATSPVMVHGSGQGLAAILFGAVVQGAEVHIRNVRTREDIAMVAIAKRRGIQVSCDVNVVDLCAAPGAVHMADDDRDALWEHLDVIDAVSGNPEFIVPLLMEAEKGGRVSLEWIESRLVVNPCRILSLKVPDDTFIEVDVDDTWEAPAASEIAGLRCRGRVRRVVLRGQIAFLDGQVHVPAGYGSDQFSANTKTSKVGGGSRASVEGSRPLGPVPLLDALEEIPSSDALGSGSNALSQITLTGSPSRFPLQPSSGRISSLDAWNGSHILSVKQFDREQLHALFNVAYEMRQMVSRVGNYDLLRGKVLTTLFYEPSTRTSCSFQAAMLRLGGSVMTINEVSNSSVSKGESLEDTVRVLESYSDVLVVRHPEVGAVQHAASFAKKTVINAGDGIGEHPTQALLDIFTIREELGTVNNITITFVGDLLNGRTVHSLARALSQYTVRFRYVSPEKLRMPTDVIEEVASLGGDQTEYATMDQVLRDTDVLYVTRIQKERFSSIEEYEALKEHYIITPKTLTKLKKSAIVMHPLPRVNEISPEVDEDPRAVYFRQAEYGMYIRMALLALVLGKVGM